MESLASSSSLLRQLHKSREEENNSQEKILLFELAQSYYNEKEFYKAQLTLQDLLALQDKLPYVHYHLALVELQIGNESQALRYLQEELKINPNFREAHELQEKLEEKSRFPFITLTLLVLNILFYLGFTHPLGLVDLLTYTLSPFTSSFWPYITSLFFHVDLLHLGINMVFLLMFGLVVEKYLGAFEFLLIYLVAGIGGAFFQILLSPQLPELFVLGASASLFGILGALVSRNLFFPLRLLGIFKVPAMYFFLIFFLSIEVVTSYLGIFEASANFAHLFGFIIGLFLYAIFHPEAMGAVYLWAMSYLSLFFFIESLTQFFLVGLSLELFLVSLVSLMGVIFTFIITQQRKPLEVAQ